MREFFNKPPTRTYDQIQLLVNRGLNVGSEVKDRSRVANYIRRIGYYRLSGYFFYFQTGSEHKFAEGCTFQDVLDVYNHDRRLRLSMLDAIERVEVAFRASVSDRSSTVLRDSHWFTKQSNFDNEQGHRNLVNELDRATKDVAGQHRFLTHFYSKYSDDFPPSWMVSEYMPFGWWSKVYSQIKDKKIRENIAKDFDLPSAELLKSWIHFLVYVRNLCAHHCRLWRRSMKIQPSPSRKIATSFDPTKVYAAAVICAHFMERIAKNSRWKSDLKRLQSKCPLDVAHYGFPKDWTDEGFWS